MLTTTASRGLACMSAYAVTRSTASGVVTVTFTRFRASSASRLAASGSDVAGPIWNFTFTELLIRVVGLAVWNWDPSSNPRISVRNNATDGDLLIAYALARAGAAWQETRYTNAAQKLAKAIGKSTLSRT